MTSRYVLVETGNDTKECRTQSGKPLFSIRYDARAVIWPTELSLREFAQAVQPIIAGNQFSKNKGNPRIPHIACFRDAGVEDLYNFPASDISNIQCEGIVILNLYLPTETSVEFDMGHGRRRYKRSISVSSTFNMSGQVADFVIATTSSEKLDREAMADLIVAEIGKDLPRPVMEEGELYGIVTADNQDEFHVELLGPSGTELYYLRDCAAPYRSRQIQQYDFVRVFLAEQDGKVSHMIQRMDDSQITAEELNEMGTGEIGETLRKSLEPWKMDYGDGHFDYMKAIFEKRVALYKALEKRTNK